MCTQSIDPEYVFRVLLLDVCGACRHSLAPGNYSRALQAGECGILPSLKEAPFYILLLHGST
jgi:hypothetical protein